MSDFHAQIILTRKEEVTWLAAVGEEGMLHSILSSLPNLYEEGEEADPPLPIPETEATPRTKANDTGAAVDEKPAVGALPNGDHVPEPTLEAEGPSVVEPTKTPPVKQESSGDVDTSGDLSTSSSDMSTGESDRTAVEGEQLADEAPTFSENDTTLVEEPITKTESEETKPAPAPTPTPPSEPESEDSDPWPDTPGQPPKVRLSLSSLLHQADDLFARFPPSHPKLDLDKIMGPRSTIFTWAESSSVPSDDELEQYVKTPHLVVLPYVDPVEEALREKNAKELERRGAERKRKLRKSLFTRVKAEKKTMLAGAVLAIGIAMAVYGIRAPGDAGRGHHRGDMKKLLRYIGGLLFPGGNTLVGRLLGH